MATFDSHANLAYSIVATAPSPSTSGTSLIVQAGDGAKFPIPPFNATIWPTGVGTLPTKANAEIVRVTAIATDTFTIVRAQEGTTAQSITAGYQIANTISVKVLTDIETAVNTALSYNVITTQGDLIIGNSGGNPSRLAIGTNGYVLTSNGTTASWQPSTGGFSNPMTTLGDVIYGAASGTPTRLAGNTTSTKNFLVQTGTGSVSAAPTWGSIAVGDLPSSVVTSIVNDTNVTGSISAQVLTLGWTGTLAVGRGGTGTGTAFTQGSIVFVGASGTYTQNNSKFFWDNTNNRLGIGTASPSYNFENDGVTGLLGQQTYVEGALIVGANSNTGDFVQFTDTFDGTSINTNNWTVTGSNTTQSGSITVAAGVTNSWTANGITGTQGYRRSNTLTLTADLTTPSSVTNNYVMVGFSSTPSSLNYATMPHAIELASTGTINIYENSALVKSSAGTWAASTTYTLKIVVGLAKGAAYYISSDSGNTWTLLYNDIGSGSANNSPLYVQLDAYAGTWILDNMSVSNNNDVLRAGQFFNGNVSFESNLIVGPNTTGNSVSILNPNNIVNFAQLSFYPSTSNVNSNTSFAVIPKGTGVSNNVAQFSVFGTDFIANSTNYEFASLRATGSAFVLGTGQSGTGTLRQLILSSGYLSGTNTTQLVIDATGNIGIGVSSPGAKLSIAAGTTSTAPLNIASGVNLTTATDGSLEYNGTHLYFTIGTTRYQLDQQTGAGSGITRTISSISVNTTAGSSASVDYVYLVSGTTTLTLPTAVGNTNLYTVKNVGTGTVTIATTSAQTIDGNSSVLIPTQYESLDLISDNSNWNII